MGFWDFLGQGIGAGADLLIAQKNLQFQKDVQDYEKSTQTTTWNREDNAVQRRITDLKAAGLSPTLAAGSAASTSSPIRVTTPQIDPNLGSKISQKAMAMRTALVQQAQIGKTKAEVNLINAQADKARSEANVLQDTEKNRIEGIIASNSYLRRSLEDRLNQVMRQAETQAHTRDMAEANAYVAGLDASYRKQLDNYLTEHANPRWGKGGYITDNPQVLNYMIMAMDQELKKHDVDIYSNVPIPSGVWGSTINSITGLGKMWKK